MVRGYFWLKHEYLKQNVESYSVFMVFFWGRQVSRKSQFYLRLLIYVINVMMILWENLNCKASNFFEPLWSLLIFHLWSISPQISSIIAQRSCRLPGTIAKRNFTTIWLSGSSLLITFAEQQAGFLDFNLWPLDQRTRFTTCEITITTV